MRIFFLPLLSAILLSACATEPQRVLPSYLAALPKCEDIPRTGSTNELSGDVKRDGYHQVGEGTQQCYDASTRSAVTMKTVLWEKDAAPAPPVNLAPPPPVDPALKEALKHILDPRPAKPLALAPSSTVTVDWLHPMTRWGERARMNTASLEQIARVFEKDDQGVLQVPADDLVRHYERVTGLNFGHSGRGFAQALRSSARLVPATVAFLETHDLSGFKREGDAVEFYNVSLYNQHPRRTPDQGEQVIMFGDRPVAMTGCLNAVLAMGQRVAQNP